MMEEVKIAAVNMSVENNKPKNLEKHIEFIEEAGKEEVKFMVFPEVGLQGYITLPYNGTKDMIDQKKYFSREAETIPGETTKIIEEYTRKYDMYVQVGMAERALHGNVLYNSAALIGPEGIIGIFRKFHNQFEYPIFNPGNDLPVFETPFARIGCLICYDLCFPEVSRILALKGAEICAMSTAWPMKGDDPNTDYYLYIYDILGRANAFSNQTWLIISNYTAISGRKKYFGHSRIIAPTGKIVAEKKDEEGLVIVKAKIKEEIEKARFHEFFCHNLLQDRRPEFYSLISSKEPYYPSYMHI